MYLLLLTSAHPPPKKNSIMFITDKLPSKVNSLAPLYWLFVWDESPPELGIGREGRRKGMEIVDSLWGREGGKEELRGVPEILPSVWISETSDGSSALE